MCVSLRYLHKILYIPWGKVQACCSKRCTAIEYVALVPGTRSTVDLCMLQKSLRASELDLCIETWHFTVSTRGQIHKRTSTKIFTEFMWVKKAMELMKNSFSSPAYRWILTSSTSNIPQSCFVEWEAAVLGDGGIICVGFRELHWCHRLVPNIVIKSGTAGTVLKLKCWVSLVLSRRA